MQTSVLLGEREQAAIREEEALLVRVRRAVERVRGRDRPRRDALAVRETLRAMRDEAMQTSEDDLPGALHDLDVQQTLAARREDDPLPSIECPYIGHLRLREAGRIKDYCLGHATLVDGTEDVRVIDWRVAPIARVFYAYREGDEYEETLPSRTAVGEVVARRLVVIEGGVLTRIVGDGFSLSRAADGTWQRVDEVRFVSRPGETGLFGVGVGAHARSHVAITASLDAEQFAAVTSPGDKPLLVLGSAGSGKTTVALHRLSRLIASSASPARARVIVPEEGLARLTRRLLDADTAAKTDVATLDRWAAALAESVFARRIALCPDTPAAAVSMKRHPAFFRALSAYTATCEVDRPSFKNLRAVLADVLTDRVFLEGVVERAEGSLTRASIPVIVRHTMAQLATPMRAVLASITDESMKRAVDGRDLAQDTPEEIAGTIDAEDLPILLFLRAKLVSLDAAKLAHVVLDEAEDFSHFELAVLRVLRDRGGSVTLAGDEAQQTSSCFETWAASLDTLGARDAATCRLEISYRCPRPVTELAQRVLGRDPEGVTAAREGAPVGTWSFPETSQAFIFARDVLTDLESREPHASIAVIAHDAEAARRFHALLGDTPARLVLDGAFSFSPGIDVTHVDEVKGLEFDYVLIPDATRAAYPDLPDARRRLHVAITRTSHQLFVIAGGEMSPLLGVSAREPAP